jgi:N-methylhydantoinase A/oxoprolinase/acetone carboxylase beta subunit/N-methylhydantoinase B/oxoprolinase/acetone carboxylase alpha subunit
MSQYRLAVDIGGTFTDVVLERNGVLWGTKVPTTPRAPEEGFLDGVLRLLRDTGVNMADIGSIIHGTTLATNALIERRGAVTALVTTEGFRDSLEIGYEARFDQYNIHLQKPELLVPRRFRYTVVERVGADGGLITQLDEAGVAAIAKRLIADRVESVAIGFLHAYANPAHEQRTAEILGKLLPGIPLSLSSEVCPEIREYERLSTTVGNAYVRPVMARYLRALEHNLKNAGFSCSLFLVTSAGGITNLEAASRFPIRLVESGPSGGARLAEVTAEQNGATDVLSYDMGGTTAKICLIDRYRASMAREFEAARTLRFAKGSGLPLRIPVVEMIEIGAGGGSIAAIDALQRVTVGPASAGAEPGPACYGRGGKVPTVTDADLALGRLDPERFAEGRLHLDPLATKTAIDSSIAHPLGLDFEDAARAICEIVDEAMANAARVHAIEHARDLRGSTMIAFGGAGPLHAGRLAEKLGIPRVIVPVNPSVGSAVGFLYMPIAYEVVKSRYMLLSKFRPGEIENVLKDLAADAHAVVESAAPGRERQARRTALMRYLGQGHEVEIELPDGPVTDAMAVVLRERYGRRYAELYGRAMAAGEIEILTWAVTVSTPRAVVAPVAPVARINAAEPAGTQPVFDPGSGIRRDTPIHLRDSLQPGDQLDGPALVIESQTTTVVPASFRATVNGAGQLVLDRVAVSEASAAESDDISLQVMWNRLQAVVDEQANVLMRTAFSPIVRESGDLSVGVFDLEGRMLAQAVTGTPGHVNTMAAACAKFFDYFPRQDMRAGDIYLTNDPWLGSGHLNDFVVLKPCFHHDRLVGFVSCTSHLVDIGGRCLGPDGSDVFDEGLYVPPIHLVDGGIVSTVFMSLLRANSRSPESAEGDVYALIACSEMGERRLSEMMGDFDIDDLGPIAERIVRTCERATRARIAALADGTYHYDMTVDGYDEPITLKGILNIKGDNFHLDFPESAPPSPFGMNVPLNYAEAYTVFGIKCVIAPDIPNNYGSLLPLVVTARPGTIINAQKPSPVCSRHILGQLLPDVALGCLSQVVPDEVPAEGAATLWDLPMKGVIEATNTPFATELVFNGGTGARPALDGLSATAFPSGVMGSLIEITESTTPILVTRRELRPDSGGAGRFRGGLGQIIEIQAKAGTPLVIYGTVDRVRFPARGRAGGEPGAPGRFDHSAGTPFFGKGSCQLKPGERLTVYTPGGGGHGPRRHRDLAKVAEDLANGMITAEAAKKLYNANRNAVD